MRALDFRPGRSDHFRPGKNSKESRMLSKSTILRSSGPWNTTPPAFKVPEREVNGGLSKNASTFALSLLL